MFELLDRVPAVALDEGLEPIGQVAGEVEFQDVWFQYQGRDQVSSRYIFLRMRNNSFRCVGNELSSASGSSASGSTACVLCAGNASVDAHRCHFGEMVPLEIFIEGSRPL